jgi:Uma2 family endonuclease
MLINPKSTHCMTTTTRQLTFEEYLNYHDDTDNRYELVDGELLEMPPARGKHADITDALNDIFCYRFRESAIALSAAHLTKEVY